MADVEIDKEKEDIELNEFLVNWLGNGRESYRAYLVTHPGLSKEAAYVGGSRMMKRLLSSDKLHGFLSANGLGYEEWLNKLKEGMEAKKTVSGIGDADSKSIEFVDVPDYKTQREYHKALGKLLQVESDKLDLTSKGEKIDTLEKITVEIVKSDADTKR